MTTLQVLLAIGLVPFSIAFLLNVPRLLAVFRSARGLYLLSVAWIALILSQARFIAADKSVNESVVMSAGEYTQAAWMLLSLFLTLLLLLNARMTGRQWRLPLIALAVYSFLGLTTAGFSPVPLLSAYKASQVLLAAVFAIVALSYLGRAGRPRYLLELTYFVLTLIMVSTAMGGVLAPDLAFQVMHTGGGGTFGAALQCIAPHLHQNGLGLLAAIMVVVATRRAFEREKRSVRYYYASLAFLSFIVLFAAQARTSLIGLAISILMMSLIIRRLRWLLFVVVGAAVLMASYYVTTDSKLGIEDDAITYFHRGQTAEQIHTMSGRTILWDIGMNMVSEEPLFGHGFQTGARFGGRKFGLAEGSNMHNSHVQVLVDSGLVGYLFWLLFVGSIAWLVTVSLVRRHMPARTETDRFQVEAALVVFMLLLRSSTGHVFVALDFNLVVFVALFLSISRYTISGVSVQAKGARSNKLVELRQ